ncbi:MAG: indole-3-glycerol phosphate synthase TrpC [Bacteroidales bacterium]|nr:indole-3-glycerol phosphate synthase TrpC [Bacteroidales bacterium]
MTFLEKIAESKRKEIALMKRRFSVKDFEKSPFSGRESISLAGRIRDPAGTGIIAEFKRCSPSKGAINVSANLLKVTTGYCDAGAAGISVLTEKKFFGGKADDLYKVRSSINIPLLRKDFILDEIQIYESKCLGADVILLIAALLGKGKVLEFSKLANSLGMEVLLEIHSTEELDTINEFVNIIGVNNRDLRSMKTDINTSIKLGRKIPDGFVKISESGISSPMTITELKKAGYDGFLIGEYFMSKPDPALAFCEFVSSLREVEKNS